MCFDGESTLQDWMVWAHHPVRKDYEVIMDLGEGAFSQVVLAQHKGTRQYAALKVVFLQNPEVDDEHLAIMKREAELLRAVASPHVVRCLDVIEDASQQVLVLEYLRGGQLFNHLHKLGEAYSEQQAAALFAQMSAAVADMHRAGIIHRDIKAENFVLEEDAAAAAAAGRALRVKLIDLGMAMRYDPTVPVEGALGSPGFVAPETAHDGVHTPAMDMFSLGVVLFIMLVGRKPFNIAESENLKYCDMDIKDSPGVKDARWLALSPAAKDLLMGLLRYKPEHRLTAKQALAHPWIESRGGSVPRPLDPSVGRGAANVAALRRLRNLAHGAVSMRCATDAAMGRTDSRSDYLQRLSRTRSNLEQTTGHRDDPSGKGISRLERVNLKLSARNAARAHDAGVTTDPSEDVSVHYRSGRGFSSVHGGSEFTRTSSAAYKGMRQSGSALALEELVPPDVSYRPAMRHSASMAALHRESSRSLGRDPSGSGRGLPTGTLLRSISANLRGLVDGSYHGGRSDSSRHGSSPDVSRKGVRRADGKLGSGTLRSSGSQGQMHDAEASAHGSGSARWGTPLPVAIDELHPGEEVMEDGSNVPGWGRSKGGSGSARSGRSVLRFEPLAEGDAQGQRRSIGAVPVTAMQQLEARRTSTDQAPS